MAKKKTKPIAKPVKDDVPMNAQDFINLRRRRNYAVFGGIVFLCVVFYVITIERLAGS